MKISPLGLTVLSFLVAGLLGGLFLPVPGLKYIIAFMVLPLAHCFRFTELFWIELIYLAIYDLVHLSDIHTFYSTYVPWLQNWAALLVPTSAVVWTFPFVFTLIYVVLQPVSAFLAAVILKSVNRVLPSKWKQRLTGGLA